MNDYRVLLFVLVSALGGVALAVWLQRRFRRLRVAIVSVVIAAALAAIAYWLGVGLAFMYLDVAPGNPAPLWAELLVGALFAVAIAAVAFAVAAVGLGARNFVVARKARLSP